MNNHIKLMISASLALAMTACGTDNEERVTSVNELSRAEKEALTLDMAEMDKPYVTALFYSNMTANQQLYEDAKTNLSLFESSWNAFKTSYMDTFEVSRWNDYYPGVDSDISTASSHYETITAFPASLVVAHEALEDVREVHGHMRSDVGLSYLMDTVTTTHHKMEAVSGAYAAYSADPDIEVLKSALANSLPDFVAGVVELASTYGDGSLTKSLYNLSDEKSSTLSSNISSTDPTAPGLLQIVNNLTAALADNNDANVITLASKVKGKFVQIFLSFGDFVTPFESDFIALLKATIPALYCTGNPSDAATTCADNSSNTLQGTTDYVSAYSQAMNSLKAHYPAPANVTTLLGWVSDLNDADGYLSDVTAVLGSATDLSSAKDDGAHDSMEGVRSSLYHLLATYEGNVSVMTRMDEYHKVFEQMLAYTLDNSLSADEINHITVLMPSLESTFSNLLSVTGSIDSAAWGVSAVDLSAMLDNQQSNITDLKNALAAFDETSNDNSPAILANVTALKSRYVPFFKAFGSF